LNVTCSSSRRFSCISEIVAALRVECDIEWMATDDVCVFGGAALDVFVWSGGDDEEEQDGKLKSETGLVMDDGVPGGCARRP
jgi:hypothetical protein